MENVAVKMDIIYQTNIIISACQVINFIFYLCVCVSFWSINCRLVINVICVIGLESKCHSSEDCEKATLNSYCTNKNYTTGNINVCKCSPGFLMSDDKLSCNLIPTTTMPPSSRPINLGRVATINYNMKLSFTKLFICLNIKFHYFLITSIIIINTNI